MATIQQIQKGFAMFVDRDVAVAFDGWQRLVVSGFGGLVANSIPKMVREYSNHPFVAALGVYDPESGNVDIEALYQAFVLKMGDDKIPITIPKLGTVKLGKQEFDSLKRYIMEA